MQIVLNADDFGHSADTVDATIACLEAGLLTSATIMPRMAATERAITFARAHPQYSFGVHLTFVGDGEERPVSDPAGLNTLVDETGAFRRTRDVRLDALLGRLDGREIEREAAAQLAVIRDAGIPITHVDSHRHLHKFGPFRRALTRVLPAFGVERVRNVQDVYLRRPVKSPTYWLGRGWRRRLAAAFTTTDHFYMPTTAADEAWSPLADRLGGVRGMTLEIGVHPGGADEWRRREAASLEPFVRAATSRGHAFVTWREIGRG
jgi:predicted glycoside hydrolase/deacetylase ChbG (UPF0249 family)